MRDISCRFELIRLRFNLQKFSTVKQKHLPGGIISQNMCDIAAMTEQSGTCSSDALIPISPMTISNTAPMLDVNELCNKLGHRTKRNKKDKPLRHRRRSSSGSSTSSGELLFANKDLSTELTRFQQHRPLGAT